MRWALQSGHVNADEVDYINAHGTSTIANDQVETTAIKRVFQHHAYKLWISSTKSMLGHAMAASGAIEAIVAIKSLMNRPYIPPSTMKRRLPGLRSGLCAEPGAGR